MNNEEQERCLDESLKKIKVQAINIQKCRKESNLRKCLKDANLMLLELRTNNLTPKLYYQLFTPIFDEMQLIENYFKEEVRRGRHINKIYDSVQQANCIIPRLYLLITVGAVWMDIQPNECYDILTDLSQIIKFAQHSIRGFFLRYFMLKMIKDKLPDKTNEYLCGVARFEDTINFLINNLEEMNSLWIRMSNDPNNNREISDKERSDIKGLLGENLAKLASLHGLNLEIYQNDILPQMRRIIIDCNDQLSQQYIMESIIHFFPDNYNIYSMRMLLEIISEMKSGADIRLLYIIIMDKITRYVTEIEKTQLNIVEAAQKIYPLLSASLDILFEETIKKSEEINISKYFELLVSFVKFANKCCLSKNKLESINHILSFGASLAKKQTKIGSDGVKWLGKLLSASLDSELSLFELNSFEDLIRLLDNTSQATLSLRIIESILNRSSKEKIDSVEKLKKLLNYIHPLLEDPPNNNYFDQYQFEYEQKSVVKLFFIVKSKLPNVVLDMFTELKNTFIKGSMKRKKLTLPPLINAITLLCYQISTTIDHYKGLIQTNSKIREDFINEIDLTSLDEDKPFFVYLKSAYVLITESITAIEPECPKQAIKLYLNAASQVNSIQSNRKQFEETYSIFINNSISIFNDGQFDLEHKIPMLNLIIGTLLNNTILSHDILMSIIISLHQNVLSMDKKSDQCNALLGVSHLFYSLLGNKEKVIECLSQAKHFAEFAVISNPQNLSLFVQILNKLIYYIEIDEGGFIQKDLVDEVINLIKTNIETLKTNEENKFISEIEKYYEETVEIIKKRKDIGKNKIYSEINI